MSQPNNGEWTAQAAATAETKDRRNIGCPLSIVHHGPFPNVSLSRPVANRSPTFEGENCASYEFPISLYPALMLCHLWSHDDGCIIEYYFFGTAAAHFFIAGAIWLIAIFLSPSHCHKQRMHSSIFWLLFCLHRCRRRQFRRRHPPQAFPHPPFAYSVFSALIS
jgi:hypothetical protein